jgi:hypothetical protein
MKSFKLIIIGLIMIGSGLIPFQSYLAAQPPCDPKKLDRATASETGYQSRSDSMCEGVYTAFRSGEPSLEMVSLSQGPITYDLKTDRQLYVDIPGSDEIKERPIRLQAVGREEGIHYQMDAYMPPKGPLIWSLKTVLTKEGIEDFMLGVYGWIDHFDRRIFLPVTISAKRQDRLTKAPIRLIVRTPLRLDWMAWRYALENQPWNDFVEIMHSNLSAGGLLPLEIPPGQKGILKIEVQGKPHDPTRKGNIWLPKILVFRP